MKARFLALAALVLGLASCQTEPEGLNVNVGGEVDTTVCVSLPEATRANSALGAFDNVDLTGNLTIRYIFEVYYGNTGVQKQVYYTDDKTASFPVRLVPGRDYNFVAWADIVEVSANIETNKALPYEASNVVENHYNADNLNAITLKSTWVAMDETRDAYTGFHNTTGGEKYTGTSSINIQMTRPFAKLRIVTTDMEQLNDLNIMPSKATVEYTTTHYGAFNAYEGKVIGDSKNRNIKHENFDIVAYGEDVQNDADMTLFTDYFFATKEQEVINFSLDVYDQGGNPIGDTKNFRTPIPAQRNYLTTISGNILTDGNNITVEVKDAFEDEKEWPEEGNSAEQLAYAAMFGGEVTLTEDVVLTEPLTIVNGANVVINLEGKTLTGAIELAEGAELTVNNGVIQNTDRTVSGITSNGDLTLNNVTIESARHGVRVESGNVVINGGEYKVAPISASTLHALNVGDDGTTANVVIKGGTFIGPKGTMADSGSAVNVRNGSSVVIEGGNFSGGKSKTLSGVNITVKGGTFDQNPVNYVADGYKAVEAGGLFYVLPEIIANAAEAAGVTAVTESPYDVATALATNNGEVALFMWNDVAYIAKYGEVVITSAADEATTVRGVVESSTGLTSATIADGIEVVGNRTFRKCANLETVALPNTLTEIGPAVFQSCSKLANITIPESVTTIGEGAFAECTALTSINIPAGVTRIESDALRATGLKSVEFHAGVTYFGAQAFRDCKQLKEVIINAPEFTIEANAFGVMSGALPGTTIYVANAEMKAYLESTLTYANQFEVVAPEVAKTTADLQAALADGERVILANDLTIAASEMTTAPYGNKMALSQNGGVFDGNGKNISVTAGGDNYVVMTNGGTIKNLDIDRGFRGIVLMHPNQDVYVDNVNIGVDDKVCYTINTAEGNGTHSLYVSNSTLNGWCSIGTAVKDVNFTNCTFGQGLYYNNVYGRLVKPYVDAVFENCNFCNKFYIDLSAFVGTKVVVKNCTVNGVKITAENWTSLVAPEDTCGEGQISVELKNGSYLTAENVADYIVFE